MKKRILFLCTGNSARSQMAEAIANAFHGQALEAVSAGSRPTGFVHPLAVRAMAEVGVDIQDAQSKQAGRFTREDFDAVVTVCDSAAQDCPMWPGAKRIEHWSIDDPSFGPGGAEGRFKAFVETRKDLERRIGELVKTL